MIEHEIHSSAVTAKSPVQPPAGSRFTFASGDRPLDGYTIKHGIGRGGFGEVYYAMTDGGKEVALKLVQRHLDVELRGVSQCLNLKNPHLVALHDIKQAATGDYWVVMEYMTGESLADVVMRHADGMPTLDVLKNLRGICEGVGYLHDHGIVHRDLKPGNIFIEDGHVKIGDYGLAKYISASQRSGQTESVGTVYYMAPEIARGRYGKEIDLYAVGVMLYEMLTGRLPFVGESPGEVLMKHLTAEPDLNLLSEPFRSVVARLLAKDPESRYASVEAMRADLDARLAGRPGAAPPPPPIPQVAPAAQHEAGTAPPPQFANAEYESFERGRLARPVKDRLLAGVCSGIAMYAEVDPVWVRLLFVFAAAPVFPLIFIYFLVALIIPAETPADERRRLATCRLRRIVRPRDGNTWTGVCNGWAAYFGVEPALIRAATVLATIMTCIFPGLLLYFLLTWIMPPGDAVASTAELAREPRGRGVFRRFLSVAPRLLISLVVGAGIGLVVGGVCEAAGGLWREEVAVLFGLGSGFATASLALLVLCRRLVGPHRIWPGFASLLAGGGIGCLTGGFALTRGWPWSANEVAVPGALGAGFLTASLSLFVLFTSQMVPLRWRWFFATVFLGAGAGLISASLGLSLGVVDYIAAIFAVGAGLITAGVLGYLLIFTRLAAKLDPVAALAAAGGWTGSNLNQTQSFHETKTGASRWIRQVIGVNPSVGGLNVLVGIVAVVLLAAWAGLSQLSKHAPTYSGSRPTSSSDRAGTSTSRARKANPLAVEWEVHRFTGDGNRVNAIAFSPDGQIVATGCSDGTVRLWDLKTDGEIRKLTGHTQSVHSLTFNSDGTRLAAAADCLDVRVWNVASGQEVCKSIDHPGAVHSVAFSPDGQTLATGSIDDIVRLIDATTGKQVKQFLGSKRDIRSVAFSPDGTKLAAGSRELPGVVRIWDMTTSRPAQSFEGSIFLRHVAFSPDGRQLAVVQEHNNVQLRDVASGSLVPLGANVSWSGAFAFNPAGGQFAYATLDAIELLDIAERRVVARFSHNRSASVAVAFSPDGSMIAGGTNDSAVRVWEVPEAVRKTKPLELKAPVAPATQPEP